MGNFLGQISYGFNVINVRRAVDQFFHLRLGGGDNMRIAVAGIHYRDAGKAVEIFAAVDIGDGSAAGPVDHDRHDRLHEASHDVISVFLNRVSHESPRNLRRPGRPRPGGRAKLASVLAVSAEPALPPSFVPPGGWGIRPYAGT